MHRPRQKLTIDVLAAHQRRGLGMAPNTPDQCRCGARIMPATEGFDVDTDIMVRRDFAFAAHQTNALRAGR